MSVELNSYPTLLNDASLKAYYRFESNLTDSKSALNGSNVGVTYAAGMFGNAGVFNGSSYFTLPQSTLLDINPGTLNFWIKLNSATAGDTCIFDHWDDTTGSGIWAGLRLHHFTDGVNKFRTQVHISNAVPYGNLTTHTVDYGTSDTAYHLLTITISGTTSKIYLDGALISTKTDHSSLNYSTNPVIYVGCYHHEYTPNGTQDRFLNGQIDDMSIFSRELNATEISDYYNVGGIPPTPIGTVKALVVGGGGAGGSDVGGGGSAGGYQYNAALSVSLQAYSVTVGNGGLGGTTANAAGGDGTNSIFSSITALGGGGGAGITAGQVAKRGGGGSAVLLTPGVAFTGGNAGGSGYNVSTSIGGGGGGGAGASGQNSHTTTKQAGNGGIGISNSISGTSAYYAGGGGGGGYTPAGYNNTKGFGGLGGGANGADGQEQVGSNATANTGGGGGGGSGGGYGNGYGGNGGSGVVIISYPTGTITATGGTITTSGAETIHTFTTSGTFTVTGGGTTINSMMFAFFFS